MPGDLPPAAVTIQQRATLLEDREKEGRLRFGLGQQDNLDLPAEALPQSSLELSYIRNRVTPQLDKEVEVGLLHLGPTSRGAEQNCGPNVWLSP
jgi:hypothetical protein